MASQPNYERHTLQQLYDVRRHIDKERFPERFALLEAEIAKREQTQSQPEEAPPPSPSPRNGAGAPKFVFQDRTSDPGGMSRAKRMVIGGLTITPIVYGALLFLIISNAIRSGEPPFILQYQFFAAVHLMVVLLSLGLVIFYIVEVVQADYLRPELRAVWAVALFLGAPLVMPIYWFLYIRADPSRSQR